MGWRWNDCSIRCVLSSLHIDNLVIVIMNAKLFCNQTKLHMQFAHRYPCYSIHFLLLHYSVVGITTKLSCTMHFFQAVLFMANEISDKCTFVLISRNQLKRKSSQILITDYATCQINYSHIQWDYVTWTPGDTGSCSKVWTLWNIIPYHIWPFFVYTNCKMP